MLAEDHLPGADVGPTIKAILVKQFTALRDGDRFFYLNEPFTSREARLLSQIDSLAAVIQANTDITNLQTDVFFFKESISGTVFSDRGHDGFPRTGNEPGVPGINVNLNDSSGNVVATTTTDSFGRYNFSDQTGIPGTGNFSVTIMLPAGYFQTTPNPPTIYLSRGGLDVDHVHFGIDSWLLGDTGHQPDSKIIGYSGESGDFGLARFLPSELEIGSFTASPNLVTAGSSLTPPASNLTDEIPSATITQMDFYYSTAAEPSPSWATERRAAPGVWTFTFTVNLAPGTYTLYAQAEGSYGIFGDPLPVTLTYSGLEPWHDWINPPAFRHLRGLAFIGDYVVVGLSRPRHEKTLIGLALDENLAGTKYASADREVVYAGATGANRGPQGGAWRGAD
jgi:hypothetical protein